MKHEADLKNYEAQGQIGSEISASFKQNLIILAGLGTDEGVTLRPFENSMLPHFNRLSYEQQLTLAHNLHRYVGVMSEVKNTDKHIVKNVNTLWRMLGKLQLRASMDLFSVIDENDVIEIYDRLGHQVYCSFNFFPFCTFPLEEVYSVPWFQLYERDEEITARYVEIGAEIFGGNIKHTIEIPLPVHEVREIKFPISRCTEIRSRHMSPLYGPTGSVEAFVHTFQPLRTFDRKVQLPTVLSGNA